MLQVLDKEEKKLFYNKVKLLINDLQDTFHRIKWRKWGKWGGGGGGGESEFSRSEFRAKAMEPKLTEDKEKHKQNKELGIFN